MASKEIPSSSGTNQPQHQHFDYQQRRLLTDNEERELAFATSREQRRRIQNRVAQRAYRQKQRLRLRDLEERLTSIRIQGSNTTETPSILVAATELREKGTLNTSQTWADLATSYPISTTLNTHLHNSNSTDPAERSHAAQSSPRKTEQREKKATAHNNRRPPSNYAIGFIQPAAASVQSEKTPFLVITALSVRTAVTMNVDILGINLDSYGQDGSTSPFYPRDNSPAPNSTAVVRTLKRRAPDLVPTELQISTEHHPYIDIIPFPSVRNHILNAISSGSPDLDQVKLCRDIETGLRIWGRAPWDGWCWEWCSEFLQKWAWLFELETLRSTNFWRQQRGEPLLDLVDGQVVIQHENVGAGTGGKKLIESSFAECLV